MTTASRTKTFTSPRFCAAIVDRLTFNGTIIEPGTDSYRLAHTRAVVPAKPARAASTARREIRRNDGRRQAIPALTR